MDRMSEYSGVARASVGKTFKPVNFYCSAPRARTVCLAGDFNDWEANSLPMERRLDGWWFVQVWVSHGHHRYYFVVDGKPTLDPRATGVAHDEQRGEVSLLAVS